ncbi:acetoacetate decarboxylase family protein [Phormidium pseudopriestleyi FRX01]|uniref:Acetoacetate decarboxylase family protein n=1 Tax=Phormidium pseudopriestleyi FRX01 TaxID=1759528 RepID=A0ABS3FUY7_9CYAN|nr:acetoacetate decarboxylase family protein [Phormidium pseudopriestleyi]MBO0350939.1 acetoacetate decarboxylase family protein [Phormidium pseudopriestleyi FRX01]
MPYPCAPWTLKGRAVQTLHPIDTRRVRSLVPSDLAIVEVFPGKTLGGVYCAKYGAGSTLLYNELIVVSALVRCGMQFGAWISHIYVDHPDSVAGGREIWGLPKELAEFTWERDDGDRVMVHQGDCLLCSLDFSIKTFRLPIPFAFPSFSTLGSNLLLFPGEFMSAIGLVKSRLVVPPESPFAMLNLTQPYLTFSCEDLRLVAGAPQVVKERATATPYAPA